MIVAHFYRLCYDIQALCIIFIDTGGKIMNREEINTAIAKILPGILEEVSRMREANRMIPISGERFTLPLKGRDVDMAYYRTEVPNAPLIVGAHGGGFLFGGSAMDDELWVNVVRHLQVNVASIDYRQSPDVMDEECMNDIYDSILYLKEHAGDYGFDPDHISVFGSSAGGNLAAAVCLKAGETKEFILDNQILMYPFLDGHTDPDEKGEGSFSGVLPHIMNRLHFSPDRSQDPILSPIYASLEQLKGLPNAIVAYCDDDNLAQEARTYCQMLRDAGVSVSEFFARRMPHGYIENGFKDHFNDVEMDMLGKNARELIDSGELNRVSVETLEFVRKHMV